MESGLGLCQGEPSIPTVLYIVHCTRYVQQWWDLYGPHEATEKMLLSDSRIPERGERGREESVGRGDSYQVMESSLYRELGHIS